MSITPWLPTRSSRGNLARSLPLALALLALILAALPGLLPRAAAASTPSTAAAAGGPARAISTISVDTTVSPGATERNTARKAVRKWVGAEKGGTVRLRSGDSITVPPNVMRRSGWVTITPLPGGRIDFHITPSWEGLVTLRFPSKKKYEELVAHKLDEGWVVEDARKVRGKMVVKVDSLSIFTMLGCLRHIPSVPGVVRCAMKEQVKAFPSTVAKKLLTYMGPEYDACNPTILMRLTTGLFDQLFAPCPMTETPPTPTPSPTPTPTTSQAPTPAPTTPPAPTPPPPPSPPTTVSTLGLVISDSYLGGTWARNDPNNGAWYSKGNKPANGAWWYPNGLGVAVDCARTAASYGVQFGDGHTETWSTWLHVTDGKWIPAAVAVSSDSFHGLRAC